jgi:DNA (cytosine-5)-methyltransferase 1
MTQKCLSLFSGAGGFDLGAIAAGVKVVASVEIDPVCCATLSKNFEHNIFCTDVSTLSASDFRKSLDLQSGDLDYIIAGPPCQPFSKSALWANGAARGMADERSDTLKSLFDFVREFEPKVVVIENVEGFKSAGGLEYVSKQFEILGQYTLSTQILLASDYGVPQKRRRLFVVAWRSPETFEFPSPTHGTNGVKAVSAWEAIKDRRGGYKEDLTPRGKWAALLPTIPEGENYQWHTSKGGGLPLFGWRTRYWSFLQKLSKADPAPTIVASPSQNAGPFHWDNRLLSTEELAALQGFPKGFGFEGERVDRQKQIGNAVPPLMAQVVLTAVQEQMGYPGKRDCSLKVPRNLELPPAAPTYSVPKEFLSLVGEHASHPGTGKGPRPRSAQLADGRSTRPA